ncbi:MAG: porphobilinogen synthase [Micavibrio sp.]|nr:porphobilinogen synthase [Micavibrio sp.]|tara:strand:+ start:460620 stop:461630 length:1011 start_codon:yes stop_codon:yes gene_type:complete
MAATNQADLPYRMRRLRKTPALRDLVRETHLSVKDLIYPIFTEENLDERVEISSMPGVYRETEKSLATRVKEAADLGIPAVILFGVSHHKDENGSDSFKATGLFARMIKIAKEAAPDISVIADVCFCEYTDHGHCGPIAEDGDVDNDATLINIGKQAVNAAKAGADIIAPSGMMDGTVAAIRAALDEAGFTEIPIMAYAAKFASTYYGPFRDAAGCALGKYDHVAKDRKTYQMDPANAREALREVELDIAEGADMVMVKPGLAYLDILAKTKDSFSLPTFSYHVSGEYAMLKAAAEKGWLEYEAVMMETLLSFKRAGADGILTYTALDAARILRNG